jgi:hypothetical protein
MYAPSLGAAAAYSKFPSRGTALYLAVCFSWVATGMTCLSSFKLLKIFRYRHVIPTGFLITEFEMMNSFVVSHL